MNYLRNNDTGAQYNFESVPNQNALMGALDYTSGPVEIGGRRGYRLKNDGMTVMFDDGSKAMLGVDMAETRRRNMEDQKFNLALEQGRVGIEGDRIKNKLLQAQIADLQGGEAPQGGIAATALGVPSAPNDPLIGLSRKAREQLQSKMYIAGDKQITGLEQEARDAQSLAGDAKRFQDLNKESMTGPFVGSAIIGGARKLGDSGLQEMESIANRIIPKMREPGSGSTSDFDAKMFAKATFGIDKDKAVNDSIGTAMVAKAKLGQDRAEFMRSYIEGNGTLRGADSAWSKYVNANPIFDPASTEAPKINANRAHWRQFFGGAQGQPAAATGARPPLHSFER